MPIERKPEFFKGAQLKVGIIGCGYVGLPLAETAALLGGQGYHVHRNWDATLVQ